jgi:hypothetical protein
MVMGDMVFANRPTGTHPSSMAVRCGERSEQARPADAGRQELKRGTSLGVSAPVNRSASRFARNEVLQPELPSHRCLCRPFKHRGQSAMLGRYTPPWVREISIFELSD